MDYQIEEDARVLKILDNINEVNRYYIATHPQKLIDKISAEQTPIATLVMCCDSRAHTTSFTNKPENNFFIVRNIGNQYILNQGSTSYGVNILETRLLIFLGHSQCGAIRAALRDYSDLPSNIIREIDHLALSIQPSELSGDFDERWYQATVNNVNQQVAAAYKDYKELVEAKQLAIIGMVLDIDNSNAQGYGKITIVNYNGNKNRDEICDLPLIKGFFR